MGAGGGEGREGKRVGVGGVGMGGRGVGAWGRGGGHRTDRFTRMKV